MGIILDTSVLIAGERRSEGVQAIIQRVLTTHGEQDAALSVVTLVELTHGIYRARTDADRERRRAFTQELRRDVAVVPVTADIAELAGRIEGEQATRGVSIAFEDLLIGATALHMSYALVTLNLRHFQMIPSLSVVQAGS
jgi:tRNA(fMet)-specific endonuclease VapC